MSIPFPLTYLRLRFHCRATTLLHLGGLRAGSNLRGALLGVMQRAVCDHMTGSAHADDCPVCWLAAANEHPGQERRGYALTPPLPILDHLVPGEEFVFHITLFGEALTYLPYFVLAVPEAGREGVGPGRGQFQLESIFAEYPLSLDWCVLHAGERLVCPPDQPADHAGILGAVSATLNSWQARMVAEKPVTVRFEYLTPLRLIVDQRLLKSPDFGVLFAHTLHRIDHLAMQFAGAAQRSQDECQYFWNLANQVRLVESQTHWQEVASGSSRSGQPTWISGLLGAAWYVAPYQVWSELLPWLLWGEVTQVGKDTAKGNGVYRLRHVES